MNGVNTSATTHSKDARITDIIAEFSEIFAAARSQWSRFAEDVHPDLSGGGLMMLQFIRRRGPVTATGISQAMTMDKAFVSRQISRLRECGLVEAQASPDDGRVQLLTVSAHAASLLEEVRKRWALTYQERFAGWSVAEVTEFHQALHRFNAGS